MKPTDPPVVVEQTYEANAEKVWNAITHVEHMRQWFFREIEAFQPQEGFETQFDIQFDDKHYLHLWKIIEVVPKERIVYDWRYDGIPGVGKVVWELQPDGDATKLTLTNIIVEAFPDDDPAFKRESCEEGWSYFLQESLSSYLMGE